MLGVHCRRSANVICNSADALVKMRQFRVHLAIMQIENGTFTIYLEGAGYSRQESGERYDTDLKEVYLCIRETNERNEISSWGEMPGNWKCASYPTHSIAEGKAHEVTGAMSEIRIMLLDDTSVGQGTQTYEARSQP